MEILGIKLNHKFHVYVISNDYDEYIKIFENEMDAIYWCEENPHGNPWISKRCVY